MLIAARPIASSLKARRAGYGFTLIELMVGVAIMGILLALAAPAFSTYAENSKLRGIAGSFLASAQTARIEAIRTNRLVQMVLTTEQPVAENANSAALSATAGNWIIRVPDDATPPVYTFVDGKSVREASNRGDGTSSVQVSAMANGVATPSITFNGSGSTTLTSRWDVNFTSTSGACAPTGTVRCLRVAVTVSGQIKACDPAATAANDTRAC